MSDEIKTVQGVSESRRRVLQIGAAAIPAVVTMKSGTAWASSSTCQVIIPDLNENDFLDPGDPANVPDPQTIPGGAFFGRELEELINTGQLAPVQIRYLGQVGQGEGLSCIQSFMVVTDA